MIDGKRLKTLRESRNLSGEELGIVAGVSRQQIARYEANQTDVTTFKAPPTGALFIYPKDSLERFLIWLLGTN